MIGTEEPCSLDICDTCLFLIANAECIECIHEDEAPEVCPHDEALTKHWGPGEITLGSTDCEHCPNEDGGDCEPWFSWSSCDGCGSHLGGNRQHATGWIKV